MQLWDYQVLRFALKGGVLDHDAVTASLNEWGAHGWEVISTTSITGGGQLASGLYFVVTLKRAKA